MHWVELALQGVQGFTPSVRVSLKPGYWTLLPQGPGAPLVTLASALCFPDGRGTDVALRAKAVSVGKAALWLVGKDGTTYRVIRELGGSGALHRVNVQTRGHDLITEDPAEMVQALRAQVGFPPRTIYEQLLTFSPAQLPSRRPPASAKGGGGASAHAAPAPPPPLDPVAAQAQLGDLEKELALSAEVDRIQFRLDGVTAQTYQLEARVKGTEALESAVAEARTQFDDAPTARSLGLPDDILAQARDYPLLMARCDEALAKLETDRLYEVAEAPPDAMPITRDGRFWTGVALGTAALATGLFSSGPMKYLALLDIPAFGLAALVALKHVEDVQWSEFALKKGDRLAEREKKIRDAFEIDAQPVRSAMKALAVETPVDAIAALSRREEVWDRVMELEGQLASARENPELVAATTHLAELRSEQEALNARLAEKGAYVRDAREVEREIARIRESLAAVRSAAPVRPAAEPRPEPLEDPAPALMGLAADLLNTDLPSVGTLLRERCSQYVSALTERRVESLEIDSKGRGFARCGGRRVPVGELPVRDLDWVYLSIRLTLVEKAVARDRLPVLIEDLAPGLEEARLPLLGRMLKHLGTMTQVLHLTGHPVFASMSDGSVNV